MARPRGYPGGLAINHGVLGYGGKHFVRERIFNTKERVEAVNEAPTKVWDDIKDLKGNHPWMILFVLALIIMVTITLRQTTAPYYFKYYVERPDLIAAFVPAYMFSAAAGARLRRS